MQNGKIHINSLSLSLSLSLIQLSLLGAWLADCFRVRLSSHRKNPKWLRRETLPVLIRTTKLSYQLPPPLPLKSIFLKLSENAKIQKSQEVHTYYIHGYYQHCHAHRKRSKRSLLITNPRGHHRRQLSKTYVCKPH